MSKHSQPRTGPRPGLRLAVLGTGALLTGLAWIYLVGAAIDFGVLAVNGTGVLAWVFTLGASFGAVVCLALMITLLARALREIGYVSDYEPRRAAERQTRRRTGVPASPTGRIRPGRAPRPLRRPRTRGRSEHSSRSGR